MPEWGPVVICGGLLFIFMYQEPVNALHTFYTLVLLAFTLEVYELLRRRKIMLNYTKLT